MKIRRYLSIFLCLPLLLSVFCTSATAVSYGSTSVIERITVDGDLSDTGWRFANWLYVDGTNGTFQEARTPYPDFSFSYAFRSDSTYLYLAVRLNTPAHLVGTPGQTTATNLRLWVDSDPSDTERSGLFDFSYDGKSCLDTRAPKTCDSVSALQTTESETVFEVALPLAGIGYEAEKGLAVCVTLSDPYVNNGSYDALHAYTYFSSAEAPWVSTARYLRLDLSALQLGTVVASDYQLTGVYGDLDCDGELTSYDLVLLLQQFAGVIQIPEDVLDLADLNGDQQKDSVDAMLLQQYLAGIHSAFPVNCNHGAFALSDNEDGTKERTCVFCGDAETFRDAVGTRVAYLPLDNRPVNQERVLYLAQSVGIELIMPEEDLYRTALDNMQPNQNGGTIGDREALLAWLREVDQTCDYFVISLDQALSGGLVGSRWLSNTDLSFEYEIMDEIIHLCETNTVILFDTVMRLASTMDYQGYDWNDYIAFRTYGQAARRTLTGEELTIENIIAGYRYDQNGDPISTSLSEEALENYHAARIRKLMLSDYILRNAGDSMEFLYLGVDDSTPQTTIQTNEINYLTALLGDRGVLSAAADELGMCCLTRLVTLLYGEVNINLSYYGPGKDLAADDFDIGTLGSNIDTHLTCLNTTAVEQQGRGLQALILTRLCTDADRKALLKQLEINFKQGVPTLLIDVSENPATLGRMIFEESDLDVGLLLGYSSWNTAGNAIGISLSLGIARYAYLSSVTKSTPEADVGFLKSMTFAYIKDITYKQFYGSINGILTDTYTCSAVKVLRRLNESSIITSFAPYAFGEHAAVSVSNFRYPWNRTFEMTFDIMVG